MLVLLKDKNSSFLTFNDLNIKTMKTIFLQTINTSRVGAKQLGRSGNRKQTYTFLGLYDKSYGGTKEKNTCPNVYRGFVALMGLTFRPVPKQSQI